MVASSLVASLLGGEVTGYHEVGVKVFYYCLVKNKIVLKHI